VDGNADGRVGELRPTPDDGRLGLVMATPCRRRSMAATHLMTAAIERDADDFAVDFQVSGDADDLVDRLLACDGLTGAILGMQILDRLSPAGGRRLRAELIDRAAAETRNGG